MDELSEHLDVTLIPDKHNACLLNFHDEIRVQVEPDPGGENLFLASEIGEIAAGKYRENVLALGLKYNGQPLRLGTFAFIQRRTLLVFFHTLDLQRVKAKELAELLPAFVHTALHWKGALGRSSLPELSLTGAAKKPSIFEIGK